MKIQYSKGKVPKQAHVAIPEGLYEEEHERQGFFEREEFDRIVNLLPSYLQDVARFAYCVGWRRSEVLTLQWDDIHHNAIHLKPEADKSKQGRYVPLMGELAAIIARREQQRIPVCPYVFHRRGQRIVTYRQAWGTARKKAGLPDKLFHDARRTVARNLDNAGVSREVAKRIIGHKTDEMYSRYRIVSQKDIEVGMQQYLDKTAHQTDK